jgi:hypothetical protein
VAVNLTFQNHHRSTVIQQSLNTLSYPSGEEGEGGEEEMVREGKKSEKNPSSL